MPSPAPLIALRAFAEVARTGSVKAAAEGLGVTPGAVSQQVRGLEAWLGASLFERRNRGLALTESGNRLRVLVGDSFAVIESAADALRKGSRRDTLVISTCGGLATSWLLPRIASFEAAYPDIELRIESTSRLVDLRSEPVDAVLRPTRQLDPGLIADRFFTTRLVPVIHPDLLGAGPPINAVRDLLHYTLLQDGSQIDWTVWFREHGVDDIRARRGPTFDDPSMAAQAALRRQGIALVWDIYVRDELEAGELVPAFASGNETPVGYYLLSLPRISRQPAVRAFRDWLLSNATATEHMALTASQEGVPNKSGSFRKPL